MGNLKKIVVTGRQSLKDLALKYYGNLEGMAHIMSVNSGIAITTILQAGDQVYVSNQAPADRSAKAIMAEYTSNNYTPATGSNLYIAPFPNIFSGEFGAEFG